MLLDFMTISAVKDNGADQTVQTSMHITFMETL